jgi:uncharacterized membrane protein
MQNRINQMDRERYHNDPAFADITELELDNIVQRLQRKWVGEV